MADYEFPEDLRFSEEDEWARRDGERVAIGITDYAQEQLGDIVFVELPEVGSRITKGEPFGVIESVKAVSDLYAPLGGEVLEVNTTLTEQPELVNDDCYGEGWIIVVAADHEDEWEALLTADAYCNLGALYLNQSRRDAAREAFEGALARDPGHVEANLNLGAVHEEEGRDERALRCYKAALASAPLLPDTHVSLALLYEKLKLPRKALDHWRRYLQVEPQGAWSELARRRLGRP